MKTRPGYCRGFTLLELILALSIMALISAAVTTQLAGAASTYSYVNKEGDAVSQIEIAYRRILHNARMASAMTAPTTTTAGTTLTVVTQPDAANGNATYIVTYALSGTNLTETDPRYNGGAASTLVSNVTAFSVTRQSLTSPTEVLVTITVGTSPPMTRSVIIYCRNL